MPYHLNSADIAPPIPLGQSGWRRTQLPESAGDCLSDSIRLDEGLHLIYTRYHPSLDVLETSNVERERAALTITVALQGCSSTLAGGQRYDFVAGHSTITAFARVQGQRRFPPTELHGPIRQLRLVTEAPLLHKYGLGHVIECGSDAQHLFFGKTATAVQHFAETLVYLHARCASVLDLHMTALGLLAAQRAALPQQLPTKGDKLRTKEREKMQRARDLLLQHYARPITLAWLCQQVGTNECTMKQGFRACFGTTMYRMLTDIRMHKACELLEAGLPTATVADRVGYRHAGSFGVAFRRYWGK